MHENKHSLRSWIHGQFPRWNFSGDRSLFFKNRGLFAAHLPVLVARLPVRKIAINPCMVPSVEIPALKDRVTGENVKIDPKVISDFKTLEKYELYSSAFGIFGKQDQTFHFDENHNFSPLFKKIFHSEKKNYAMVDGQHSLEKEELEQGFFPALDYFGIKHS